MTALVLALRLIHIVGGVFWVGSALLNTFFIAPAVAATADAGQKFMSHLATKARLNMRVMIASILSVLAGAWLYWIDSQGFASAWQSSGPGVGFGLGGLFALVGLGFGMVVGNRATQIGRLAGQAKGKPSTDQLAQVKALQRQMTTASKVSTGALVLALLCMATARYWLF